MIVSQHIIRVNDETHTKRTYTIMATKKLSESEKKQLVKEILGQDYSKVGNNWPVFSKVIDYVGTTSDAFTIAELIPVTSSLVSGSATLTVVGSTAGVLSIFLMPVGHLIAITNAWQSGHRSYSYRSVAYTITAWAFNQPRPVNSSRIITNIRSGALVRKKRVVTEYKDVWRKTSLSVIKNLDKVLLEKGISKHHLQFILQALGNGSPQQLCLLLLRGMEAKMDSYAHKQVWKSNYKIAYPH